MPFEGCFIAFTSTEGEKLEENRFSNTTEPLGDEEERRDCLSFCEMCQAEGRENGHL